MRKNALRIVALVLSVIMTLGAMTVVSFADGETVAEYKVETTAKRFATQNYAVKYPWGSLADQPGLLVGYGFDAVSNPTSVTIDLVVDIDPNNPDAAPGYHWTRVMLYSADERVAAYLEAKDGQGFKSDTHGKFSVTMPISATGITVDRIDLCFITNRHATFAVESVSFDGVTAKNFGVISVSQVAKDADDAPVTDGTGHTFSFDTPVDMSAQNSLTYRRTYQNTYGVTSYPGAHKSRLALTDINGNIYSIDTVGLRTTTNDVTINGINNGSEKFVDHDTARCFNFSVGISKEHADSIGFDLSKVVQVDFYLALNEACSVKIHDLQMGGKRLLASNTETYYGDPENADVAISAEGSYGAMESGTFAFNPVDVAEFSKLKVNFTPINKAVVNSKISEGPYMWTLKYTLTSSNGTSIDITSSKDNIGDLHETQLELLDIAGLDDVVSITVTLNGNKKAAYFFDFSFVNGEGIEKAAVTADKNIIMAGHQRSLTVDNGKMGLRFIAAVDSIEGYTEIGFDVASTGKVTVPVSGTSVYTSILGKVNGEDTTYYALNEYGYNYLYAIDIGNIDTTLGTLEFEITPWAMVDGEKVTFESMTVTYNGANLVD